MRQSTRIANQAIARVRELGEKGDTDCATSVCAASEGGGQDLHEALIHHFKIVAHGFFPPVGEAYAASRLPRASWVSTS